MGANDNFINEGSEIECRIIPKRQLSGELSKKILEYITNDKKNSFCTCINFYFSTY